MQGLTVGHASETVRARAGKVLHVEDFLAWVYGRQKAHVVYDQGLYANDARAAWQRGSSPDGCAGVERLAVLGVRVDGGGRVGLGQLHPDAEAAHEWVLALPPDARNLLLVWGKRGEAPDWAEGFAPSYGPAWRAGPAYNADGRPRRGSFAMLYDASGNPIACAVAPSVEDGESLLVEHDRAEYMRWHAAASAMAAGLRGLRDHVLRPPRLPLMPWRADGGEETA